MYDSLSAAVGREVTPADPARGAARAGGSRPGSRRPRHAAHGKLVEELWEHLVERPSHRARRSSRTSRVDTRPLVREHRSIPGVVEKWDLYVARLRARDRVLRARRPGHPARAVHRAGHARGRRRRRGDARSTRTSCGRWSTACRPSGGVGMGIDRLLMALTGLGIRETILFPLVKPDEPRGADRRGRRCARGDPSGPHVRRARHPRPRRRVLRRPAAAVEGHGRRCTRTCRSSWSPSVDGRGRRGAARCTCCGRTWPRCAPWPSTGP